MCIRDRYTAGQCTWYVYGMRQKMGKPVSTYWHDAHKWNDRAKAEGYKVDKSPRDMRRSRMPSSA
ncbi:hypothetical protein JMUB7527_28620 [Staphylococcus aureus]